MYMLYSHMLKSIETRNKKASKTTISVIFAKASNIIKVM